jgi:hypothetical protein
MGFCAYYYRKAGTGFPCNNGKDTPVMACRVVMVNWSGSLQRMGAHNANARIQ